MIAARAGNNTVGPMDAPILAVADLHGHPELFDLAVGRGHEIAGRADSTVVTLGDYVDNGPDVPGLLDRLIEFDQEHPGKFLPIVGNHDLACLLSLTDPRGREAQETWWERWRTRYPNGIDAWTPTQYGASTLAEFRRALPPAHLAFLKSLPWCHRLGSYAFVHAGMMRGDLEPQLAVLDSRDVSNLPVGHLPPQVRERALATVFDPAWDCTVCSGHSKNPGGSQVDYVGVNRITLHSASCRGEGLHAVLLPARATVGEQPTGIFFSVA